MKMVLAVLLLFPLAGVVHAAGDDSNAAKRLFVSGSKHFDLGEYDQALTDFKEAYRLREDPVFLYNIAQCHRLLKHHEDALRAYKTYLRRAPDSPVRGEVEQRIVALQEVVEKQNRAATMPPDRVLGGTRNEPATTGPATTTPLATTPATATPATSSDAGASGALTATAPPRSKPVYKKWWFWTAIGAVVVVGVGVGLGVGLSQSSSPSGTTFPAVSF
jgi:tetratricopeptide (TPR) repeat protein